MVPTMLCGLPASKRFAWRNRALAQFRAYARRRDDLAILLDELAGDGFASVVERPTPQIINRAAGMGAKVKIQAGENSTRIRDATQEVEKLRGRHREQLRARDEVQHPAFGLLGNHRKALVVREQLAEGGIIGTEYLIGIAVEGHGDEGQAKLASPFARLRENRPVTDVHAIENADDENGAIVISTERSEWRDLTRTKRRWIAPYDGSRLSQRR